jgi:ORF6N domain
MSSDSILPPIYTIRSQRVMLDSGHAQLYQIATKAFDQAMARNMDRFPVDFAFQLPREEVANLKSQIVTSSSDAGQAVIGAHGGARKLPWAFTEHGAIMAATILRSGRAVAMSVYLVRAFVRMREELLTDAVILKRVALIDRKLMQHDLVLRDVLEKLTPLLTVPDLPPKRKIGLHQGDR